jgi:hypothetical protein
LEQYAAQGIVEGGAAVLMGDLKAAALEKKK